jgi:hypothetical protein
LIDGCEIQPFWSHKFFHDVTQFHRIITHEFS